MNFEDLEYESAREKLQEMRSKIGHYREKYLSIFEQPLGIPEAIGAPFPSTKSPTSAMVLATEKYDISPTTSPVIPMSQSYGGQYADQFPADQRQLVPHSPAEKAEKSAENSERDPRTLNIPRAAPHHALRKGNAPPSTMWAAAWTAPNSSLEVLKKTSLPLPAYGTVLLKVHYVTLHKQDSLVKCMKDSINWPIIPGRSIVGTIERVGPGVGGEWEEGMLAGVSLHGGHCRYCPACRDTDFATCDYKVHMGVQCNGGLSQYTLVRNEALVPLPKYNPAMLCGLLTAGSLMYSSLKFCIAKKNDIVVVNGIGELGHLGIQIAKSFGYTVVAISTSQTKESLCTAVGADLFLNSNLYSDALPSTALSAGRASPNTPAHKCSVSDVLRKLGGATVVLGTTPVTANSVALLEGLHANGELILTVHPSSSGNDSLVVSKAALVSYRRSITGWPSAAPEDVQRAVRYCVAHGVKPVAKLVSFQAAHEVMKLGTSLPQVVASFTETDAVRPEDTLRSLQKMYHINTALGTAVASGLNSLQVLCQPIPVPIQINVRTQTMRACIVRERYARPELVILPLPSPGANCVRVRVLACGLSRIDEHTISGSNLSSKHCHSSWLYSWPRVPGCEVVGVVDELGAGCSRLKVGERVGIGRHGGHCGQCYWCGREDHVVCTVACALGASCDGGLSEFIVVREESCFYISNVLSNVEAAGLIGGGGVSHSALLHSGASSGDVVAIHGVGCIGHVATQYAVTMGYFVVALNRGSHKRGACLEAGCFNYINTDKENLVDHFVKLGGAKAIISTVDTMPNYTDLVECLSHNGRLLVLSTAESPVAVNASSLLLKRRTLQGWPSASPRESEAALEYAAYHGIRSIVEPVRLEDCGALIGRQMPQGAPRKFVVVMSE